MVNEDKEQVEAEEEECLSLAKKKPLRRRSL